MAFKMRGKPVISGTNDHRSALQYKQQADAEYESALKKLSAKQKQMDVNNNDKIDAEDLAALRQSPNNANMSPADANYGSPADANYGSPANANVGDSPNKYYPLVVQGARALVTRAAPIIGRTVTTQAPKLLRNVTTGLGSVKSKVFNFAKKTIPYLATYGYGSYAGGEREKTKQKAKENVTKNQPKTGGKGGFFGSLRKTTKSMKEKMEEGRKVFKKARDIATYKKAVKGATTHGDNLNDLIRQRQGLTKGTPEYNAVQNRINRAYGVSKRHGAGLYDVPAADPVTTKGDIKKTKIQTKADKRKGEVDENVARKTTKRAYKTAKKSGTAQEKADAKVKMLEAKLADYEGAKGGKKRVLFGNYLRKRTRRKLDEAKQQAGSPANFGPGKNKKSNKKMTAAEKAKAVIAAGKRFNKGETVEQVKGGMPFDASVRGMGTNKSKAKMKSASVGDKLRNLAEKRKTKKGMKKAGTPGVGKDSASSED